MSRNKNFTEDVYINEALRKGEWKQFVVAGMEVEELTQQIADNYELDEYVVERLQFVFEMYSAPERRRGHGGGNKKRIIALSNDDSVSDGGGHVMYDNAGQSRNVSVEELNLVVQQRAGDVVEEDCSCDSLFMLEIMLKVAQSMRQSFYWVPQEEKLFLVMDNAGGHGTSSAILQYTEIMRRSNIEII